MLLAIIVNKQAFFKGAIMTLIFFILLSIMFMPLFGDMNAFNASDQLFNSISKGSTYYIPALRDAAKDYDSTGVDLQLKLPNRGLAATGEQLFMARGYKAKSTESQVLITGSLGKIASSILEDADDMFYNRGAAVSNRYNIPEKRALYTWWEILKSMESALKNQKKFKEAAFIEDVMSRGVSVGYNFYQIEPESASSRAIILSGSLVFYVLYTLWWGFAIFFLAEGLGLQLKSEGKKET